MKENGTEETAKSEAVLELQAHLNDANEEVRELKQMLEEAGEAFTEKEAEINKLRAALDDEEACIKKQVRLARNKRAATYLLHTQGRDQPFTSWRLIQPTTKIIT